MNQARAEHAATLLNSGKVLISGGNSDSTLLSSAEVYDPSTNAWTLTAAMSAPRRSHTATLLPDGKVLISGGDSGEALLSRAEAYDPATDTWAPASAMSSPRTAHTATLLIDGKVLISGGDSGDTVLNSSEVYDPATNTWAPTGSMSSARTGHTATLLNDGKVLISGGLSGTTPLESAEVYDPATNTWAPASAMGSARTWHAATLLANGKVLISGGLSSTTPVTSAEVYDPATDTWSAAAFMPFRRSWHTATLRHDGKVLIAGGASGGTILHFADVYDPATDTWTTTSPMGAPRRSHTATRLTNGKVLVAGGYDSSGSLASVEVTTVETSITEAPADPTNQTTAAFSFTADEPGATFECSLDSAPFSPCVPPMSYALLAEGPHTFRVQARDEAGNVDPTPETWSWTVDLTPPDASFIQTPPSLTNQTFATFGFTTDDFSASFECTVDEMAPFFCTPWTHYTVGVFLEGPHTLQIRAHDAAGNIDPTPATHSWTVDLTAPGTHFTETPPEASNQSTATFHFKATEENATFACNLDSAGFTPCSSPITYAFLAAGPHTFQVRARDAAGNEAPSPATYFWTIDLTAPDTGPLIVTRTPSWITFSFSSPDTDATFECSLDEDTFSLCTSPVTYGALAEGPHTFRVRARDAAGNVDPTPETYSWLIDLTAPDTHLTETPRDPSNQTITTCAFSSTETSVTFECSLDEAPFSPCPSPMTYASLAEGPHTFQVRARDAGNNLDPTPATWSWTIDLTTPDTGLTATPPNPTHQTTATFAFSADDTNASFQCSLDEAAYSPCSPPMTYDSLTEGPHTFRVRARDAAGNVDPTPAAWSWTIDLTAPNTSITAAPPNLTEQTTAAFSFSADEPGATFECSLDDGAFSSCSSPMTYDSLAEGPHTFRVRARDAAGNVDATPATWSWTIDLTAPDTSILATPPNPTHQTTASFAFSSTETGVTFECSLDEAAFSPCTSPVAFSPLARGTHTFLVRARDALGNVDSSPARHSWIIDLTAPETRINAAPLHPNNQTTATFIFTSTEGGSSFECSLDSLEEASFSPCSSPVTYAPLAEGPHIFRVRARDAAGNLDSSPAAYSWTIDLTPVETQLTSAPGGFSSQATATFSFTSETEATFECSLDEAPFSPCVSPMNYSNLPEGPHTFRVRARDASGNVDETPEQLTWRVDTVLPETSFASTPELETRLRTPSFSFSSSEPRSTFECSLDGAPFAECPDVFPSLDDGPHRLAIRARDEAGNLDPTPARYDWKVDNLAPEPPSLQEPAPGQELFTDSPLFSGTAEPHATVLLLLDGAEAGAFEADSQGLWRGGPSSPLTWGAHRVSAQARDKAGNTSALAPDVAFSTVRRGYYGVSCAASPSTWQTPWPWALLLLALLRNAARRR